MVLWPGSYNLLMLSLAANPYTSEE